MRERPIVLPGEVHDNAVQHALRFQAFDALLAAGARPALLMAQFDRERQGDIDRARDGAQGAGGPKAPSDQFMARGIAKHADRGVVLPAGNGHTRRDIGVPRRLPAEPRARSVSIGLLEDGDASAAAYDHAFKTPRQSRPDPCEGMRKPAAPST